MYLLLICWCRQIMQFIELTNTHSLKLESTFLIFRQAVSICSQPFAAFVATTVFQFVLFVKSFLETA